MSRTESVARICAETGGFRLTRGLRQTAGRKVQACQRACTTLGRYRPALAMENFT